MNETWKSVVGYKGYYSVSDLGRVRRDKGGKATNQAEVNPGILTERERWLSKSELRRRRKTFAPVPLPKKV